MEAVVGVPWSKREFLEEALKTDHPMAGCPFGVLDEGVKRAMFETLTMFPEEKAELLAARVAELRQIVRDAECEEKELRKLMDVQVA